MALVRYRLPDATDLPASPTRWAIQRFSPEGTPAGEPEFLSGPDQNGESGGDLLETAGGLLAGWRQARLDASHTPAAVVGLETYVARAVPAPGERSGPWHAAASDESPPNGGDVALAGGLVISGLREALVSTSIESGEVTRVLTENPQWGEIDAADLGDGRAVVVWSEDVADGYGTELSTEVAIVSSSGVEARERVFGASPVGGAAARVVVVDDDIWIARYVVDLERLRESRIRVAHLSSALNRTEPDRWFSGWGGLAPQGLDLAVQDRTPWVLWRGLDARYGANPVLFAQPLQVTACGHDVSDPVSVWRAGTSPEGRLLAAAHERGFWVAIDRAPDASSATLYRIARCD